MIQLKVYLYSKHLPITFIVENEADISKFHASLKDDSNVVNFGTLTFNKRDFKFSIIKYIKQKGE